MGVSLDIMGIVDQLMGYNWVLTWEKQCHKPPMTGNGLYIPPLKMVMTGGWFMALFYPH